jgi:hypothetical protein
MFAQKNLKPYMPCDEQLSLCSWFVLQSEQHVPKAEQFVPMHRTKYEKSNI